MKHLLAVIASIILFQGIQAQAPSTRSITVRSEAIPVKNVPGVVITAHSTRFPNGRLQKWESRKEGYIARFTQNGKRYFAYYSNEGVWKGTESLVKWTRHLPDAVQEGWKNSGYHNWYVHNIRKIETPQQPVYVLHLNNGTLLTSDNHDAYREDHVLYFTPEGELIKKDRI